MGKNKELPIAGIDSARRAHGYRHSAPHSFDVDSSFQAAFEHAPHAMALIGLDGSWLEANQAMCDMLGDTRDSLFTSNVLDLTYPADRDADILRTIAQQLLSGERRSVQWEKRWQHKDGHVLWGKSTVSMLRNKDGEPECYLTLIEDISDRKRIEAERDDLLNWIMNIHYIERLRLAGNIHDLALQQLLGISYQIVAHERRDDIEGTSSDSITIDEAEDERIRQQILGVVQNLRTVIDDLRPAGLQELGISMAIRGHVAQLSEENAADELQFELDLDPNEPRLPALVANCLFRVVQEAIANVLRHAQARRIIVVLHFHEDEARLSVQDDGIGFQAPENLSHFVHSSHYGLISLAQQVGAVGGNLSVAAQPGSGTCITVRIPLGKRGRFHERTDPRAPGRRPSSD